MNTTTIDQGARVDTIILFGTESGNAEMVADDIAQVLSEAGQNARVCSMEEFVLGELSPPVFFVVVCSTYGEGGMPSGAEEFYDSLVATQPDLTGVRFAAYGLGDSNFESYNNGINVLSQTLINLGATEVSTRGRHDASGELSATDHARLWTESLVSDLQAGVGG
ncbi:flavodoxin domain-containing protein [Mycolicibacterium litorale]|uniref:flavodoxin domain-containing protein n=1 Tax=Mycolicibacterium litorale TaxID=758802 RepID=UPI003CEC6A19